ncbi:hypothetical protein THIOKS11780002 [Thiocapsa sp. KS1]|nr:hypothetical protein THIOKS11780002 [Thiocapsa sp. KS1]
MDRPKTCQGKSKTAPGPDRISVRAPAATAVPTRALAIPDRVDADGQV